MIKKKSHAKVNLTLHIGPRMENGYHSLSSVMNMIELHDEITIEKIPEDTVEVECSANIPTKQNLCYKAAKLMRSRYSIKEGVRISIVKNIPIGSGLGGGSSNAATVIKAINEIFGLNLSNEELLKVAREIGSDVPFFISGCAALVEGTGEIVKPLSNFPHLHLVLVYPEFEISTRLAYELFDKKGLSSKPVDPNELTDPNKIASYLSNDIQDAIFSSYEGLLDIRKKLIQLGALNASLSGSGPSIYGIFSNEREAIQAAEKMKGENFTVVLTKTLPSL